MRISCMKKFSWKLTVFILIIALGLLLAACTNSSEGDNDGTQPDNEPAPSKPESDVEDPTLPVEQAEKYYVNVNNYLIKAVDPDNTTKPVLLTFDDAPKGLHTATILDTLDKYDAKAIFFVTGYYADRDRELIKEIYDRGHIIGNHTWGHENLNEITTREETESQVNRLNVLIKEITGEDVRYLRPPYGAQAKNPFLDDILRKQNIQKMNWSLGSRDWEIINPERYDELIDEVTNSVFPGANILMHDIEITALALDKILANLLKQGYEFVLPTEVIYE